ncbi:MAG TPA: NAD(P)/FAD-dependent oxidoreductase [Candidatus Acidoferrales bacterium]|nr:NAD(P)/FAD-dependent oxidoreductase [Candidatus Acidoferrales bacterium]
MISRSIAIIGGGPSGALCAERLASAGLNVCLFDDHLAWEKPCGGGLTHKALCAYPFLLDNRHPKKLIRQAELISPHGERALLPLHHPIAIYSRTVLNGLLLERAERAGCRIVRSRVSSLELNGNSASFNAQNMTHHADFLVLAAGARNSFFPDTQPFTPSDLELTIGYFIPTRAEGIQVKFVRGLQGYIWSFPRCDHLSVGICGSMARHTSRELHNYLDQFTCAERISLHGAEFYSHVLPSPRAQTLAKRRVAGPNWALIGDAAGWVDPITGEGLYYALRSGELLAESLIAGKPEVYPRRVRDDFAADLEIAARIADNFYHGRFLGGAVTTRMIQFVHRSATFRAIVADLFSGSQKYATLKRRVWSQLATTLAEVFASHFRAAESTAS